MKNPLKKLKRRGDHKRPEHRDYWRPDDDPLRMPRRGSAIWTPQDLYEFDMHRVTIDAMMKGRGLQ